MKQLLEYHSPYLTLKHLISPNSIKQITDLRNGNMLMICNMEICNLRKKISLRLKKTKELGSITNMIFHPETCCDTFHVHFRSCHALELFIDNVRWLQLIDGTVTASTKDLFTWRWGTPGMRGNPPSRGRKIKRVYMQSYNPGVLGWGFLRLLLRLQLRSLSRGVPSLHFEKKERLILEHICIY